MKAYHFLRADFTAGSGDEKPWEIGEQRIITETSRIALCEYGYHASPTLWDALSYAPGPLACLVTISTPIHGDVTKSVSATRRLLKAVNIDRALRLFACDCAERVLSDNAQLTNTIEVARRFANSKASVTELHAALCIARDIADKSSQSDQPGIAWTAAAVAATAAMANGAAIAWATVEAVIKVRFLIPEYTRTAEVQWQRAHFDEMFGHIFD